MFPKSLGSYGRAGMKICDPDSKSAQRSPFTADCHHLHANDRSIVSRGISRNKGLESGPVMAKLEGGKKTALDQLPQTPASGLAVLQVNVRDLCLDTSDDMELTTNKSNTVWG